MALPLEDPEDRGDRGLGVADLLVHDAELVEPAAQLGLLAGDEGGVLLLEPGVAAQPGGHLGAGVDVDQLAVPAPLP